MPPPDSLSPSVGRPSRQRRGPSRSLPQRGGRPAPPRPPLPIRLEPEPGGDALSMAGGSRENGVWIAPSATDFSCLCEHCLDVARGNDGSFLAAVRAASVR